MPDFCPLCPPLHGVVTENAYWTLVLNENQATLGRAYFALKRHETAVSALSADEILSLWQFAAQTKQALEAVFAPDHFNYLFHMNLTPHVHMHIYPRYASARDFAGQTFADTRFGDHYNPQETHQLDDATFASLLAAFRIALTHARGIL